MREKTGKWLFILLFIAGLIISGINPHDYFTWGLEVFPVVIVFIILIITHSTFRLTGLLYSLILIHSFILFIGGHYTYAEVPFFDWLKDIFQLQRNNYDKVGHFAQGFIPAIAIREVLIRKQVITNAKWQFFIIVCICLSISAAYEFLEWFVAEATGDSAEAFLGTQGYVWDTQSDMLYATIGSIISLTILNRIHDHQLKRIKIFY
ncbi:MAG: DUF2238 domain-containing protein [Cytophagaceae bacterium]